MKIQILRVCVLLVSISAASVLVWNATRDQKPRQMQKGSAVDTDEAFDPEHMQVSPKSGPAMSSDDIAEIVEEPIAPAVTDEEVKRTRDMMMSTSKSGKIMSDDKIREMLEEQKKEELELKKERKLMPSSKSIDAILSRKDVEGMIEGDKPEEKLPFIPSSKNPSRLLDQKDVEKIIERGASDFIKPVEPEK